MHCGLFSEMWELCTVQRAVWSVHCAACSMKCTLCSVQYGVCSVYYGVYIVQRKVWSVHCAVKIWYFHQNQPAYPAEYIAHEIRIKLSPDRAHLRARASDHLHCVLFYRITLVCWRPLYRKEAQKPHKIVQIHWSQAVPNQCFCLRNIFNVSVIIDT